MKVTISTPGRFQTAYHFARYLDSRGELARLITPIPHRRGRAYGVARERTLRLSPFAYWYHGFERYGPRRLRPHSQLAYCELFDRVASRFIDGADVLNAWSNIALHSIRRAHALGLPAVVITGSTHIGWQTETLRDEFRRAGWDGPLTHRGLVARTELEYEEADAVVVPSGFAAQTFVDRGIPSEKLFVVPWAVKPLTGPPSSRPAPSAPRVLFVGHCSVRKGVHDLLSAFRHLSHPASLRLVGPVDSRLLALAGGLPANAEAIGPRRGDALAREYCEADVFVLASVEEGSALVVTEAMAAGLPVVVSDRAGADHVEHGVNGFVFPAGDRLALRENLEALVSDAGLRARIGRAAAESVCSRTWAEYGRQLHEEVFAPLATTRSS